MLTAPETSKPAEVPDAVPPCALPYLSSTRTAGACSSVAASASAIVAAREDVVIERAHGITAPLPSGRTKIIATIGPAQDPEGALERLLDAGVDVLRVNLSHAGREAQAARVKRA